MKKRVLEPPAYFTEHEREIWRELGTLLLRAGRLTTIDVPLFHMLVVYTDEDRRYSRLAEEIAHENEALATEARTIADNAARMAAKLWAEFMPKDS